MTENPDIPASNPSRPEWRSSLRRFGFILVVLFLFLLVGGYILPGLLFAPGPTPSPSPATVMPPVPPADDARVAELTARLDQTEARLKAFEDIITALPKPAAETAPAPDAAPEESGHEDNNERLTKLEESLAALQEGRSRDAKNLAALAALSRLKDALTRGEPLDLASLESLAAENPAAQEALAKLAPWARKSLPGMKALRQEFEAAIPKALAPGQRLPLGTLIRIRKIGEREGADDESVIARAEAKLEADDLEAALKEIAQLSPQAAPAFAEWTARTQSTLEARRTIAALEAALAP